MVGGIREDTQEAVAALLLGDEANMHALDPAKVHLDRIALHYAALQWCSISAECGETDKEVLRRRT